ncbi:MAG: sigma-70 family RNA polymerase sigma factor [Byssovorax sp.]
MSTATPSSPPDPPKLRSVDEHLTTAQAFRRFVARVSLCAGRWTAHWGVAEADRDDVLQEALLRMYRRRDVYDPALGSWESWAFAFVGRVVLAYRSGTWNRIKRVDVAVDDLPDVATDAPGPEEETEAIMMQALVNKCMANLDGDSRAILHANAEGIEMVNIATALGLSLSGAYARLQTARARLQAALDREQRRKLSLGVAVLPLSIDQLLASDTTTAHFSAETMRRIWTTLDRLMSADLAAGNLRDDGTDAERYMGSPNAAPPAGLGARILRTLGPRALSALTHVAAAAVSALVTYALMAHDPTQNATTAEARAAASSLVAPVAPSRDPSPTETAAPSAGAVELPELRADVEPALSVDAGAAERTDAGPGAAGREDLAGEQSLFDLGSTAYQAGYYEEAIKAFREHASKYPQGHYSAARERLFTLALIRANRRPEARQRIERIRRANPASTLLAELDAAVNARR